MCTAGAWPAPDPRVDGKQAEDLYQPQKVLAEPGELAEADRGAREGQWGEGACPPTPLPRPAQLWLPEMSLFTARRQDFLLLEKRAFLQGPRGTGEGEGERAGQH